VGGSRSKPAGHGLDWLNAAPDAGIRAALGACCAADSWVSRVGGGRPYPDEDALYAASAAANAAYEQRFRHVYLVCATGGSAAELLAVGRSRLGNDPVTERRVVLGELAKISQLRLRKLLTPENSR
jgi:2-oxo-4-hydroxy-4-carboxy--5-ureidoimidazoline (OHCU) decarboxylase